MQRIAQRPDATLLLADGTVFHGKAIGKKGTSGGELCFNTGMTGYQEIYTDPSYFGQIVIHTMAHIGNYGVVKNEVESDSVKISGMICDGFSGIYSRTGGDDNLDNYLAENGIVGIAEIDTRKLVKHIRHKGVMNAIISSEILQVPGLQKELAQVPDMESLELASRVMTSKPYSLGQETGKRVAVLDYGIKQNIVNQLALQDLNCLVLPGNAALADILAFEPDAFFISNGPGDPASMDYAVDTIKQLLETKKPLFGICLGHQLLARAYGLSTFKMKNGHRGLNHPVKNLISGHCEITSQNHGFAVDLEDVKKHAALELTHINLNDNSVEGIRTKNGQAFSVQYHPEANPGPHDSRYLFGQFKDLILERK
jgi:carbamoyl-phosphate synthase small subunit